MTSSNTRRSRFTPGALVLCLSVMATLMLATLLFPGRAHAQSPTYGVFELKAGGYFPSIDSEFGDGAGPFESFFGSSNMLLGEVEVDFYLWQGIGTLGVGFHAGYGSRSGDLQARDGEVDGDVPGTTSFAVVPLRVSAVYRYDYSAHNHGIPLVPVFKIGLDYHLWRVRGADGEVPSVGGRQASGGKTGWHAAVALHLHLDIIDPSSAAAFDMNWGINNSYLFAEYVMTRVDGFGGTGLDLSDDHWMFGLAFEF